MASQPLDRMPGNVKWALAGMWFQALSNIVIGLLLLSLVNDEVERGREVEGLGLIRFFIYLGLFVGGVLIVSAVCAGKRFAWVRMAVLVVEGVALAVGFINLLVSKMPVGLIGLVIALAVFRTMLSQPGRAWFNR